MLATPLPSRRARGARPVGPAPLGWFGIRPLRRLIQREVDDRIADLFVTGSLVDGGTVTVDASVEALSVRSGIPFAAAA